MFYCVFAHISCPPVCLFISCYAVLCDLQLIITIPRVIVFGNEKHKTLFFLQRERELQMLGKKSQPQLLISEPRHTLRQHCSRLTYLHYFYMICVCSLKLRFCNDRLCKKYCYYCYYFRRFGQLLLPTCIKR